VSVKDAAAVLMDSRNPIEQIAGRPHARGRMPACAAVLAVMRDRTRLARSVAGVPAGLTLQGQ
jgi:hypothetical protein